MRKDSIVTEDSEVFYVYVLLDPRTDEKYEYEDYKFEYCPFYVGFGREKRSSQHTKIVKARILNEDKKFFLTGNRLKKNIIKRILEFGREPVECIISSGLKHKEANSLERELIALIGRRDQKTGTLTNLTDGGEGQLNPSAETKRKILKAHLGRIPSPETKERISKSRTGKHVGEEHWMRNSEYSESRKVFIDSGVKTQFKPGQEPHNKDKTYEELYGEEKANELKKKVSNRSYKNQEGSSNFNARKRLFIDPDGKEYYSCGDFRKFLKEHKLNRSKIRKVLHGELEHWKGWKVYDIKE